MNDYRHKLREYLTRYNLTLAEFCEWSGLPYTGLADGRTKYAQQVYCHLLQRHPLATPEIPHDLFERIEAFRSAQDLTYHQLEQRWDVSESTLTMWSKCRPSPRQWRRFCGGSGYADIMQQLEPPPRKKQAGCLPEIKPALRGEQRFVFRGTYVYHPKHGWGTVIGVVDNWATVQCQDGVERYYLITPHRARLLKAEFESI